MIGLQEVVQVFAEAIVLLLGRACEPAQVSAERFGLDIAYDFDAAGCLIGNRVVRPAIGFHARLPGEGGGLAEGVARGAEELTESITVRKLGGSAGCGALVADCG